MDKQVYYRVPESHAVFIEDYAKQKGISKNSAATMAVSALMEQDAVLLLTGQLNKIQALLTDKIVTKETEGKYYAKTELYCDFFTCKVCGHDEITQRSNYCPGCGAKIVKLDYKE